MSWTPAKVPATILILSFSLHGTSRVILFFPISYSEGLKRIPFLKTDA